MLPGDRHRFGTCLLACAEIYGKDASQAVTAIWWDALSRFEIDSVESAFKRHINNPDIGQFMPKPADIVRMLEGTSIDSAFVAWSKVDKAVRAVGPYQSVAFDDPIIHRALHDMGGWIGLGSKTEDEWPFIANDFRTRYQGSRARGELPEYPPRLIGIAEAENVKRGAVAPECVLIGNAERARVVMEGGSDKPMIGITQASETVKRVAGTVLRLADAKGNS